MEFNSGRHVKNNLWNPEQYSKFEKERSQPFFDLLDLVKKKEGMRIVDLGCGTGELTRLLHRKLGAKSTLGIDNSEEMLNKNSIFVEKGLSFIKQDVREFAKQKGSYDLILSNACLQWLPDHPKLIEQLSQSLAVHGQLAIQVPSNFDFPTHTIAKELGQEEPYKSALEGQVFPAVLSPEEYSALLFKLNFSEQVVRLQVYGHALKSAEDAVEWVKGSLLTSYEGHMSKEMYRAFFLEYRERVLKVLGDARPFFYPFKRILIWASRS